MGSSYTHTLSHKHTKERRKKQVGSRELFNTHLRPRLKRQSTSSPGALQRRASPHAPPNFTHGCTPVEVFSTGFWSVSAEPRCSKSTRSSARVIWAASKSKLFKTLWSFFFFLNIWLALFQKTDAVNLENGRCLIKVLSLGALSMRAQTFGRPPRWDGWWIRWQRLDPGLCVRCYRLHVRRSETGDRGRLTDPGEDAQPEDQTH